MKRILLILIALTFVLIVKAQKNDTLIYTTVEHEPEYPGGMTKFHSYFSKNIHLTSIAANKEIKTKLLMEMIIEKDGRVSHAKVLKSISHDVDKQAIDALRRSPKWLPGINNGKPVRVRYQFQMIIDWSQE